LTDNIQNNLSDILAQQNRGIDETDSAVEEMMHLDSFRYNLMTRIFGMNGRPDKATNLLREQLRNSDSVPSIAVWNTVLDSWSKASSQPGTVEEAFALFELLQNDQRCKEAGVEANKATFGYMLKVSRPVYFHRKQRTYSFPSFLSFPLSVPCDIEK